MIGSSHSQLCKKNSSSVKLQRGSLHHNPRKIPVEDSRIIILLSNSKCLLLCDKQMPHEILFSLLDEIQNIKKMNTRELKERKFEKEVRAIGWVVLIFILVFAFLSSTVEEDITFKLNEMFVFGILFICYVWLLRLLWNDLKFSRTT